MYISIVEIDLPEGIDLAALREVFREAGRRYTNVEGLLRKYYTLKGDSITGGVFVWDTLEHAKAGHADADWREIIRNRYGSEPRVTFYEVPVIVDNVIGEVLEASDYLEIAS